MPKLLIGTVTRRKVGWRLALTAVTSIVAVLSLTTGADATGVAVSSTPQKMPTFNGGVYAMAYDGSTIYVGGSFTQANYASKKWSRGGLAAINAQTGALLPWAPTANGQIKAIAVDTATHNVYVGGAFTTINGTARSSLAEIGPDGTLAAFTHTLSGTPQVLTVGDGLLYLGGHFTAVDSVARSNLAAFSLASGALSTAWAPAADDAVAAIVLDSDRLYLAGKFRKINSVSGSGKLVAVSPTTGALDPAFKPTVPIAIYALAVGPGGVYAAEGGSGGRAVDYTTAGAAVWTLTTDGDAQAITYFNGVVYVGGHFDNACKSALTGTQGHCTDGSVPRVKLAAADASTGALLDWNPSANGVHGVFTMAASVTLGTVAAGGEFTTVQGVSRGRFAQFH